MGKEWKVPLEGASNAKPSSPAEIPPLPLLARIYELFLLVCPACGTALTFIAFLTEPEPITTRGRDRQDEQATLERSTGSKIQWQEESACIPLHSSGS